MFDSLPQVDEASANALFRFRLGLGLRCESAFSADEAIAVSHRYMGKEESR